MMITSSAGAIGYGFRSDRISWLDTRAAFALLCLAAITPFLFVGMPPLVDLYGHYGRYVVQTDLANRPALQEFYSYQWQLIGNLGGDLLVEALDALQDETLPLVPQPVVGVTYAEKITKAEGNIDWKRSAVELQRTLRAFDPFPGASTLFNGEPLKCFNPQTVAVAGLMGTVGQVLAVSSAGFEVQCGQGVLRVRTAQKAGAKRQPAHQVAQALGLNAGSLLGA